MHNGSTNNGPPTNNSDDLTHMLEENRLKLQLLGDDIARKTIRLQKLLEEIDELSSPPLQKDGMAARCWQLFKKLLNKLRFSPAKTRSKGK